MYVLIEQFVAPLTIIFRLKNCLRRNKVASGHAATVYFEHGRPLNYIISIVDCSKRNKVASNHWTTIHFEHFEHGRPLKYIISIVDCPTRNEVASDFWATMNVNLVAPWATLFQFQIKQKETRLSQTTGLP